MHGLWNQQHANQQLVMNYCLNSVVRIYGYWIAYKNCMSQLKISAVVSSLFLSVLLIFWIG